MTTSRSNKGDSTQSEIIHAAAQLFVQQGYHGTSMRQIAKATGLALGSAYNHFPSKEAIFRAVFFEYHPYHSILPKLRSMTSLPVEQFIHQAIATFGAALEERPFFLNLMFIEIIEFKADHILELFQQVLPLGAQIAETIIHNNPRLRPIPPLILMRSLMGFILSYYTTEYLLAPFSPVQFRENGATFFADIFLHGILLPDMDTGSSPSHGY